MGAKSEGCFPMLCSLLLVFGVVPEALPFLSFSYYDQKGLVRCHVCQLRRYLLYGCSKRCHSHVSRVFTFLNTSLKGCLVQEVDRIVKTSRCPPFHSHSSFSDNPAWFICAPSVLV